jgi:enterochelin esterase-like enzyme
MNRYVIFALVCLLSLSASAQTFQAFINRVNSVPDSQKTAIVDSFMTTIHQFPYVENDTLCHFIYRGSASSMAVAGDQNQWSPSDNMIRIQPTDFWYCTRSYERDARLDYKFVQNGSNWILDPRNPYTCSGGYGPNSELRMPAYVPAPEIAYYATIPHGTLRDTTFHSAALNNNRTVRIYLPPNYDQTTDSFRVILVHDGLEYVSLANMDRVLDYEIAHHRIQPVIGVFVPPVNRTEEYAGGQMNAFSDFLVNDVAVWISSRYRVLSGAQNHATLGASNGGNIALWLGVQHPDVFGCIAAQSSNVVSAISDRFAADPNLPLRLYLDLGTYDIAVLQPMVRSLVSTLYAHGYDYRYQEYHEGHSWGNWRAHIDNALEMFFPGDSAVSITPSGFISHPSSFNLSCYPNPFNATTTISFTLPSAQKVSLKVYDLTGRVVATLLDSQATAGNHRILFKAAAFASGVYFYEVRTPSLVETQKLLLLK